MGKPLSNDLRERLISGIGSGQSRRAVANQFKVAPSTAVRVMKRYEQTGHIEPARQGRPRGSGKLGPYRGFLIEQVRKQPDITMPELASVLKDEHGVQVHPTCLSKLLCAAGFSYKKKRCWQWNKSAVMSKRLARSGNAIVCPPCVSNQADLYSSMKHR